MRFNHCFIILLTSLFVAACSPSASQDQAPTSSVQAARPTIVGLEGLSAGPVLGIVIDSERKVIAIEPASVAQEAGLQLGDIIEEINGFALTDQASRPSIKESLYTTPNSQITLLRAGSLIELEVAPKPPQAPSSNTPPLTPTPVQPPNDYL